MRILFKVLTWMQKLLSFDPSFPSFSLSFSLFLLLLILDSTDVCIPLLCLFPTQFRAEIDFSRAKKETHLLCSCHTAAIAEPTCLIAHLLAPHDRAQSHPQQRPPRVQPPHRLGRERHVGSTNVSHTAYLMHDLDSACVYMGQHDRVM